MIVRTQTIEIDGGQKVLISSLTVGQTKELLAKFEDKSSDDNWPKQVICWSLNNILIRDKSTEALWTLERVESDIDVLSMTQLWEAIFLLTKLKTVKPGEAIAAEKTENSPSSAA